MYEIVLTEQDMIRITQLDNLTTNIPFYHVDRIATMNVMIYVLSGIIYVSEEEQEYAIHEGELLFLKEGTHQYGTKQIEAGTSWIYAHFHVNQVEGYESADNQSLITLPKLINLNGYHDVRKRLKQLCDTYRDDKIMSQKRAELGLYELFLDIEELVHISKTNRMVIEIDSYIACNLSRNLSGEDFEREFHMTYKYLNKVYKQFCGRSIMQAYHNERMKAATVALRTTKKPVNVISDELGFRDALYFSKCFRCYAGVSPRTYRQLAIQNF